jgi:hypothetical protein
MEPVFIWQILLHAIFFNSKASILKLHGLPNFERVSRILTSKSDRGPFCGAVQAHLNEILHLDHFFPYWGLISIFCDI